MSTSSRKAQFPRAQEITYLDTAAEGLPPQTAADALAEYWREKSRGTPGRRRLFEMQRETECAAARLLGTTPEDVVVLANSSEALNLLANSLVWESGDEVLLTDLEFPSNVLVWLRLKKLGVTVHVIPTSGGVLRLEDFTSRLSRRTRLVSVSQVSYKTGTQIPFLPQLTQEVHRAGGLLCVDATQALGRVPVAVDGVDYLVASSYKWLLGVHGAGLVYCSPGLRQSLEPGTAGWYSAKELFTDDRFENYTRKESAGSLQPGMPNFPAYFALRAGVDCLLSAGVERFDQELRPVVAELRAGIEAAGLPLLTPAEPEYASGIVSFAHERGQDVAAAMEREGVVVWGGDGRVRASVHLYNDEEDVEHFLGALQRVLRG